MGLKAGRAVEREGDETEGERVDGGLTTEGVDGRWINEGVVDRGATDRGAITLGGLTDRLERLLNDGITGIERELDGELGRRIEGSDRELDERLGRLNEGSDRELDERLGRLNEGSDRELDERLGRLNEGNDRELDERLGRLNEGIDRDLDGAERLNDGLPPRATLRPEERDTDRWAHTDSGDNNATRAIARPRERTANWGENIELLAVDQRRRARPTRQFLFNTLNISTFSRSKQGKSADKKLKPCRA